MSKKRAWVAKNCTFCRFAKPWNWSPITIQIALRAEDLVRNTHVSGKEAAKIALGEWMENNRETYAPAIRYYQNLVSELWPSQSGRRIDPRQYRELVKILETRGDPAPRIPKVFLDAGAARTVLDSVLKFMGVPAQEHLVFVNPRRLRSFPAPEAEA